MSKGGRYLSVKSKKPKKKLGVGAIIGIIIASVFGIFILTPVIFYFVGMNIVDSHLDLLQRPEEVTEKNLTDEELAEILGNVPVETVDSFSPEATVPVAGLQLPFSDSGKDIINILVIGQAYRENEESKLSDSIILCTINKNTKTLTMTSFLRDMYIQLPNYKDKICGMQRINVCYNLGWHWGGDAGAMQMINDCLYNNFGIEVDYNIELNFVTFDKVIELMGGVEVELTEPEVKYLEEWVPGAEEGDFAVGLNTLDGPAALTYARCRKIDNDMMRATRQRNVITSLINKCRNLSFKELSAMAKEILPLIITNMSNEDIKACMFEILPMLPELKIENNQCPAEGTWWGKTVEIGGVSSNVLEFDLYTNKLALQEICEGITPEDK